MSNMPLAEAHVQRNRSGGSDTFFAIIKVEDRLHRLFSLPRGKRTDAGLQSFQVTPLLVVGCLVDKFSMVIEVIEEYADIMSINVKSLTHTLVSSNMQL